MTRFGALDVSQFAQTLDHRLSEGRGAGIHRGKNTELDHPSWCLCRGSERRGEEHRTRASKERATVYH
jgi:hypothetical protein